MQMERERFARGYLAAAALCAGLTLLATPLLGVVDLANIALLFVLVVVISAARWGRGAGVFASFVAVFCFDVFFVPPRFSLTVADAQYLIIFVVMLAVSLVISHLTNAYREKALEAEQRARELTLLHNLAGALSGALTLEQVNVRMNDVFARHLGAEGILFLPDDSEKLQVFPTTMLVGMADLLTAQGVYANGQSVGFGVGASDVMIPLFLPMEGSTRRRGVLGLRQAVTGGLMPDAGLATAIAAVVSTAIERLHFVAVAQQRTLEVQTERLRSSILSAVSHDLRTPLTVLYGLADSLLQRGDLLPEQQATVVTLRDHSHRLHRMVDNLLDMARLKSGRLELRRDWQSIAELAGASVQAMSLWLDASRIRFAIPADLPLVQVDALLLERAFFNLLENAARYSTPGSPVVIGAGLDERQPDRLAVWVSNDGDGFPEDRLPVLFELFERGHAESRVLGMGVGLAVCRAIVEAHGGEIVAVNLAGGAEVRFFLPLLPVPPLPAESDALPGVDHG